MIKRCLGAVLQNDAFIHREKFYAIPNGSTLFRSSRGRPYRVNGNFFLAHIRPMLLSDFLSRGLWVRGSRLHLHNAVLEQLKSPTFSEILPDDLYDAVFLSSEDQNYYTNPNTGLKIQIVGTTITNMELNDQTWTHKKYGYSKGGGSAYHSSNNNPKSVKRFGHTFTRHGAGSKNTQNLIGRAASTRNSQGQWLDNQTAATFLNSLPPMNGPTVVPIPQGLGQVIHPNGSITTAGNAMVIPNQGGGGFLTAYPIE